VMGDIGTHAHNLVRFITGLEVSEVAAEVGAIVPGRLVDDYAAKFGSITDADATAMLKKKMELEKEREALKQTYTKKVAKVLPPIKALRYAQVETRVNNAIRNDVYTLIPIAQ